MRVCNRFNYGIHHGRVSIAGHTLGESIIKKMQKVLPGKLGRLVGEIVLLPMIASTELVSGIHNVLVMKKGW